MHRTASRARVAPWSLPDAKYGRGSEPLPDTISSMADMTRVAVTSLGLRIGTEHDDSSMTFYGFRLSRVVQSAHALGHTGAE
jgi:hypothetical protein